MLITVTCFDSTKSSSGYLKTVFKLYKVAVHIWDPKGLQQYQDHIVYSFYLVLFIVSFLAVL